MPIENSLTVSPLRQSLASVGDPNGSFSLNAERKKQAEEELNETPENLKQEVFALRQMVQSKGIKKLQNLKIIFGFQMIQI